MAKPTTKEEFKARLQWLYPGQALAHWYLLCDKETVNLPEYIRGVAKGLIIPGVVTSNIWRKVDFFTIDGEQMWAFVDDPLPPIRLLKPITKNDYLTD